MARRRGATAAFVYHASVQKQNLGPAVGFQKIGTWCSPPDEGDEANRERAEAGEGGCEDTTGAPTVSCTIGVALSAGEPDAFSTWEDAFLRVRFGSGEIDEQILECDLVNGTSFPLIARNAIFELVYKPVETDPAVKRQPKIDVQISIGVGVLGSSGARGARRTVLIGDIPGQGGGTSPVFPIPPFAVGAVYASTDATATVTMTQGGSFANATPILAVNTIEKFEYRSVPVRHGARAFTITTVAPTTGNAVIFYLSPA
jgi:hypothetical protein